MNIFKNFFGLLKAFKSSSLINIVGLTVALIVFFIVGLYTICYCTSVDESEALKGSFSLNKRSVRLRNALIVVQLAVAICLIGVTQFIKQQNAPKAI